MKQSLLLILLCCYTLPSFAQASNLLPMYRHQPKSKELQKADNTFIKKAVKEFGTRSEGAAYHAKRGWDYLHNEDPYMAMKRFNQAWQLDSNNASAHWGFATITALYTGLQNALPHFEKAISLDSTNYTLLNEAANTYLLLFEEEGTISNLEKSVRLLHRAVPYKPQAPRAFAMLAHVYSYYPQKDSAIKYMNLTYAIDSVFITPEIHSRIIKQ